MRISVPDLGLKLEYVQDYCGRYMSRPLEKSELYALAQQLPDYRVYDAQYIGLDGDHHYHVMNTIDGGYHLLIALQSTNRLTVLDSQPRRLKLETDSAIITDRGFLIETLPISKTRTKFIHAHLRKL